MMKRKGFMKRGIAIAVAAISVFASASTILAYEPFLSVDENNIDNFDGGNFGAFSDNDFSYNCDFSVSENIFIYEDGTQEIVTDKDMEPRAICNHTMTSGYYHIHKPNNSGGCTVEVYNAQKCTKCGYLKLGSISSTTTYTVCPH